MNGDSIGIGEISSGRRSAQIACGTGNNRNPAHATENRRKRIRWSRVRAPPPTAPRQRLFFGLSESESSFIHRLWRWFGPAGRPPGCELGPGSCTCLESSKRWCGRRWSAPIRADNPSSSIRVASDLRKLCVVTPAAPSSSRTWRHCLLKFVRFAQTGLFGGTRLARPHTELGAEFLPAEAAAGGKGCQLHWAPAFSGTRRIVSRRCRW